MDQIIKLLNLLLMLHQYLIFMYLQDYHYLQINLKFNLLPHYLDLVNNYKDHFIQE